MTPQRSPLPIPVLMLESHPRGSASFSSLGFFAPRFQCARSHWLGARLERTRRVLVYLAACLALLVVASPAAASVQRFAVIVGNNIGHRGDAPLRYADSDAAKVGQVLRELGGFEPVDIVLLRNEEAGTVRRSLIEVNDRIRAAQSLPNTETLLFVYYSGHADGRALRMGDTELELRELAQLVRGSAAKFRLLVVDACRAGELTRVKGGRIVAPFEIAQPELGGEGMALLTAAADSEDAQESDELRGSFFTHAFVSGLLGAADRNGDGSVVLEEAYQHAYSATIAATSRTFAGTQHPTFQYNVKGQGGLVLTKPGGARVKRAELVFPGGADYLVLAESESGQVIGEVGRSGPARALSLAPGRYFVRGRAPSFLLEGTVSLSAGSSHRIDPNSLERVEYARLVRKGDASHGVSSSIELGGAARIPLSESLSFCPGAVGGYRADFASVGIAARFGFCLSQWKNESVRSRNYDYELGASVDHTWDGSGWSFALGGGLGARLVYQTFESRGYAPARTSLAPSAHLLAMPTIPITRRLYLGLNARLLGYLQHHQASALGERELKAPVAVSTALLVGAHL